MNSLMVVLNEGVDPVLVMLASMKGMIPGMEVNLAARVRVVDGDQAEMLERLLKAAGREFVILDVEEHSQPGQVEAKADLFVAPSITVPGEQQFHDAVQKAVDKVVEAQPPSAPLAGKKVEALREKRQAEKGAKKTAPKKRAAGTKGAGGRVKVVLDERECEFCSGKYFPKRKDQKFCYDPECRKGRMEAYQQAWVVRNKVASSTHTEDPEALAAEELRGVPVEELERVVVPAAPLDADAEVREFEEMLSEEEELDPALMAVDFADLDPEDLQSMVDDEDETIIWTLCANGERFTDDALKIVLAGKVLLPGTLVRRRGGRFYTVTGMHGLKQIHLTAEISNGFVDRSRYNHNGFKQINESLGRGK